MPDIDVIASIASTIMSTVVATVALVFSYRQNVGWRPVALVTDTNMSGFGGTFRFTLQVRVEFWNRRKYPVALRYVSADITGVTLLRREPKGLKDRDFVQEHLAYKEPNTLVEPHASQEVVLEVDFENQSLDALRPLFAIKVGYFDPHRQNMKTLRLNHRFFYPELGWKKTDAQRSEILRVYDEVGEKNKDHPAFADQSARTRRRVTKGRSAKSPKALS